MSGTRLLGVGEDLGASDVAVGDCLLGWLIVAHKNGIVFTAGCRCFGLLANHDCRVVGRIALPTLEQ